MEMSGERGSGRYVSVGVMASALGVPAATILTLLVGGVIDADADRTGDIIIFHESQIQRAKEALDEAHHERAGLRR